MKTRCRSRCRTLMLCIYSLVSVLIFKLVCYIWGQWHLSQFIKYFLKYSIKGKLNQPVPFLNNINNLSHKLTVTKAYPGTRPGFLSWFNKDFPGIGHIFLSLQEKNFYSRTSSFLLTYKSSRNNFSIINNKTVSWIKVFNNVLKYPVFSPACLFIKNHKF